MKKLMILFLSAAMAFCFAGTALAQPTTVELDTNPATGTTRVFFGPMFTTAGDGTGASAYVVTGSPLGLTGTAQATGTSLYAISNTLTNAAGTLMRSQRLRFFGSGETPMAPAQIASGGHKSGVTVVVQTFSWVPGHGGGGTSAGTSIYAVNAAGGKLWEVYEPYSNLPSGTGTALYDAVSMGTPICLAPLTIDDEFVAKAGSTIYAVSGSTVNGALPGGGVSIFALNAASGVSATINGGAASNATAFPNVVTNSAVSTINAAPVISGNSLFVIGWSQEFAGATIFGFDKNNLRAGVSDMQLVGLGYDRSDQFIPTPAVRTDSAGTSIFLVDNNGGVTVYTDALRDLSKSYTFMLGDTVASGVTAGPVINGDYLVLCGSGSVSGYQIGRFSGTGVASAISHIWTYSFTERTTPRIWATPAMSSNFVYVTVVDEANNNSYVYRFNVSKTNPDATVIHSDTNQTYGSPIAVGHNVWTVSFNPEVKKIAQQGFVNAKNYWRQFKFDKAKSGRNTIPDSDEVAPADDDDTCFISTLK
jgi:hypothetical protein